MPGAGDLRERITFEERKTQADVYGNAQTDFVEQFTVSANVVPVRSNEALSAARLQGQQLVRITVRRSTETLLIGADWRARNANTDELYAITSQPIDPDGRKRWLEILALTGAAA